MGYDKYGRDELESAAYSRRLADHSGWAARSIADRDLDFTQWSERQRARDRAAGNVLTEAETVSRWDAAYPDAGGRQSRRGRDSAEGLAAELRESRLPRTERAQEIGKPTR